MLFDTALDRSATILKLAIFVFVFFWGGGPTQGSKNLKIPIIGSKIKVVVNFIYGYQNLSVEKYKTNEKRISSIGHTSYEKNPKNYPKTLFFRKVTFRVVFGIFLITGMSD